MERAAVPDPRKALVEHREALQAQPRPKRIEELVDQPDGQDDGHTYRLYRPEWVVVYVATTGADHTTRGLVEAVFAERYFERVRFDDVRIITEGEGVHEVTRLELRLPNLKGEFKHGFLAQRFADEQGYGDYEIVVKHSPRDHEIRAYGTKRLPK